VTYAIFAGVSMLCCLAAFYRGARAGYEHGFCRGYHEATQRIRASLAVLGVRMPEAGPCPRGPEAPN
jgi:hypothetical protein